ncbi:ribose-phosphate pyrophosphokinase [Lysinibacillus xylanilyticus]|uniref:ribose-phosphate pyrophosphokinase n=1 Tax=Lysinibacillus xylanilyticus TaxID=582475 RepID=UPI003815912E
MLLLNGYNLTINSFPNGELNILNIEEAIKLRKANKPHHFILKYESDKDLMALFFAKRHLDVRMQWNNSSDLSIAYMPYSRMDRAETPETPFMLKFVCNFINDMRFNTVYVHEPHSAITPQLLNNVVEIYDNINLVKEAMRYEGFNPTHDYIVFPDKGAMERYKGLIESPCMLYGKKEREFSTGKIIGLDIVGDKSKIVEDNSIALIVDDLSSYGGTFVHTSKKLKELGFASVALLVAHAENSIFKGQLFEHVDRVYTTDSILTEQNNWENQKYKDKLHVFGLIEQMKAGNKK